MWKDLIRKTLHEYDGMDRKISRFQLTTGLRCPPGCGICCESHKVEATILECLPLADAIYRNNEDERALEAINEKKSKDDLRCVLFFSEGSSVGCGRCSYYGYRPLVCRLFGFSSRKDKFGYREFCLCKVVKANDNEVIRGVLFNGTPSDVPVYQDSFMRIATLHPDLGFTMFPINIALQNALAHLFWKYPRKRAYKRAA